MRRPPLWLLLVAHVAVMAALDLYAAVELDRMCMQSGLLGRLWKNKHCNNAARDLENGPFALLDLALHRVTDARVLAGGALYAAVTAGRRLARRMRRPPAPPAAAVGLLEDVD